MYSRFSDEDTYDMIHSGAASRDRNDVQAGSRDGTGQLIFGRAVYNKGGVSYADQGARSGIDVAYLYDI